MPSGFNFRDAHAILIPIPVSEGYILKVLFFATIPVPTDCHNSQEVETMSSRPFARSARLSLEPLADQTTPTFLPGPPQITINWCHTFRRISLSIAAGNLLPDPKRLRPALSPTSTSPGPAPGGRGSSSLEARRRYRHQPTYTELVVCPIRRVYGRDQRCRRRRAGRWGHGDHRGGRGERPAAREGVQRPSQLLSSSAVRQVSWAASTS